MNDTIRILTATLLSFALTACQIEALPTQATDNSTTATNANDPGSEASPSQPGPRKDVMVYWQAPTARVNGSAMPRSQIGGYELRYRPESSTQYTTVTLSPETTQHLLIEQPNAEQLEIEVAVFDNQGIYSDFVRAIPN